MERGVCGTSDNGHNLGQKKLRLDAGDNSSQAQWMGQWGGFGGPGVTRVVLQVAPWLEAGPALSGAWYRDQGWRAITKGQGTGQTQPFGVLAGLGVLSQVVTTSGYQCLDPCWGAATELALDVEHAWQGAPPGILS